MAPHPGNVYEDDPSIPDEELLYRIVTTATTLWSGTKAVRGTTNAFQDRPEAALDDLGVPATGVSVFLSSQMETTGRAVADLLTGWGPDYGVVSLLAGAARAEGQGITRWPTERSPEHGMIFVLGGAKKSKGQSKRMAAASVVVIAPPPPHTSSGRR